MSAQSASWRVRSIWYRHWRISRQPAATRWSYILETSDRRISKPLLANILMGRKCLLPPQRRARTIWYKGRGDAYCGMLNASYNPALRNIKAYIPGIRWELLMSARI